MDDFNLAEKACINHLNREFPGVLIERLPTKKGAKTCDFKVHSSPPCFVEVKEIGKFAEKTLEDYAAYALRQIESSAKEDNQNRFCGVVWLFTFDTYCKGSVGQLMVEKIQTKLAKTYPFLLTVQVYGRGLYGDCTFVSPN